MKRFQVVLLLCALQLTLLTSGCKWSIVSITGPNCASTGQTITIYITGASQDEESSPSLYGLILQIPDSWGVLSATATTTAGSYDTLTENTQYASLYTPEPGHKIWVGTATKTENQITKGTATVQLSVGDCTGQVQIKAAVGSYRNEAWTTDDPLGEFNFLNITEQRYVDTISCNCSSLSSWSPMTSGTTDSLNGVWGSSGSDVFAVGGNILHYNGTSWSPMTSGTTNWLTGVWGSSGSDVFAVGDGGNIVHYNGTSWSPMTSGTTNRLNGVWGSSGSDVFAVGLAGNILHYNGTSWSPMTSGTTNWLTGVWGSSGSDVFAVGVGGTILRYRDILYVSSDGNCGSNEPCYSSMQAALNAAKSGALIKVEKGTYKEAPTKSTTGTVTISGGWNDTFTGQDGTTSMYAPMATGGAVLKVQPNIKVVAP